MNEDDIPLTKQAVVHSMRGAERLERSHGRAVLLSRPRPKRPWFFPSRALSRFKTPLARPTETVKPSPSLLSMNGRRQGRGRGRGRPRRPRRPRPAVDARRTRRGSSASQRDLSVRASVSVSWCECEDSDSQRPTTQRPSLTLLYFTLVGPTSLRTSTRQRERTRPVSACPAVACSLL
jgi:hypothetical protein